jgi:DNA-binding transcriptional regulator GbsR (MarR family)
MTGSGGVSKPGRAAGRSGSSGPASPSATEVKNKLYSSFANVAALMGYSEVHGRIMAALTAAGEPMALQDLARETGYSLSSVSTSLDLLEVLGMVRKVKRVGDRRVYVQVEGDLLEGLKRAIVMKGKKSLDAAFTDFGSYEAMLATMPSDGEREKVANILRVLREELERLQLYLDLLGNIELPHG